MKYTVLAMRANGEPLMLSDFAALDALSEGHSVMDDDPEIYSIIEAAAHVIDIPTTDLGSIDVHVDTTGGDGE